MQLRTGNLWNYLDEADTLFFTANSFINRKGELVMGRGMALQVKERFPSVPEKLGKLIERVKRYGIVLVEEEEIKIGAFQVKYHFKDKADMELISYSSKLLGEYARQHPQETIFLNFPGIGYGGLREKEEHILSILESELPDNVVVFKFKDPSVC